MLNQMKGVKKLLLVVDLLNGFIRVGNMADLHIQHILPESERLIKKFLEGGYRVVYVKDCHKKNSREFKRFPVHCLRKTYEAQIVDELLPFENEAIVIEKNSTSAIFNKLLLEIIEQMPDLEEIVIIGCCTDICVLNLAIPLQNYLDEINRDIKITIPKNAVETFDAPTHPRDEYNEIAFKLFKQSGINLVDSY